MRKNIPAVDLANILRTPEHRLAFVCGYVESALMAAAEADKKAGNRLTEFLEAWRDDIESVEHPEMPKLRKVLRTSAAETAPECYRRHKLTEPLLVEFAVAWGFKPETASSLWKFVLNNQKLADFMAKHEVKGVLNDDGTVSMSRLRKLAKLIASENWKTRGFSPAMRNLLTAVTAL